jgi:hypothetical protein
VNWYDAVHLFVKPWLDAAGGAWPAAGTVEWASLPDDDCRKWAAILAAASHHVLRVETAQVAMAAASKSIAGAQDWASVAREIGQRSGAYIPRSTT